MIVEVRNPALLKVAEFRDLLDRALATLEYPALLEIEDVVKGMLKNPNYITLLGLEAHEYKALSISALPLHKLDKVPQVILFYSTGSKALTRALAQQTVDKIEQKGYNKFWAINRSGRPDAVWQRALTPDGATSRVIGSIMEFTTNG